MHDTPEGGRHKLPEATKGDVDRNGDVVDCACRRRDCPTCRPNWERAALDARLLAAIGTCVGVDPAAHAAAVRGQIDRVRLARAAR